LDGRGSQRIDDLSKFEGNHKFPFFGTEVELENIVGEEREVLASIGLPGEEETVGLEIRVLVVELQKERNELIRPILHVGKEGVTEREPSPHGLVQEDDVIGIRPRCLSWFEEQVIRPRSGSFNTKRSVFEEESHHAGSSRTSIDPNYKRGRGVLMAEEPVK
jgi:hypothetical protein